MEQEYEEIISELELRPGACESLVKILEEKFSLPKDILDFLLVSNGAEGTIGNSYLVLWSIEEILTLNKAYSVSEFAPGIVIFGSDGGNLAYAYDRTLDCIVEIPFVGMSLKEITNIAKGFQGFLFHLFYQP